MSVKIENEFLAVRIKQTGAELFSIVSKENQLEYMWGGNPSYWGKTSPVLFPIVGTLKNNTFIYRDKSYTLNRHGFAREATFNVVMHDKDNVVFSLTSNEDTLRNYPFPFELRIKYALVKNRLIVTYVVINKGSELMYFSLGAHPAFKIPLTEHDNYSDYYLEFDSDEDIDHWPISKDGLIESNSIPLLVNTKILKLTKQLFYNDALVLKDNKLKKITLKSGVQPYGLTISFEGFPFFGIWAARDANFVCLEPWCGIADSVTHDQLLEKKEGIQKIQPGESWSRHWSVELF